MILAVASFVVGLLVGIIATTMVIKIEYER